MAGKWTKLKGKHPIKVESENRDKIDKVKNDLLNPAPPLVPKTEYQLIELFKHINDEKNAIEERLKDLNVFKQAISEIIIDKWDQEGSGDIGEGVTSKKFNGIGTVSIVMEPYSQFLDIQKFKPYLEKFGMIHLIKEDIAWQSGNSFIKSQLEEGKELPPEDVVKIFLKNSLRIYKEK